MHVILFTDVNGSIGLGRYAGTYRIATEMRNHGWDVDVIDFMMSFSNEEIKTIILNKKRKDTKYVGFSTTFLMSRDFDPFKKRTIIRQSSDTGSSLGMPVEEAQDLVNFISNLKIDVLIGGSKLKYDLHNVKWITGTAEEKLFKDFNFTNSTIKYNDNDYIFEGEHLPLEIARGCIFKCKFCSYPLNGKALWEFCKSPEVIKKELETNFNKFGTTGYMFSDDTYNDSVEKIDQLYKVYQKLPFNIEFSSYARLDLIISHPETLPMLVESGLKSVFFGIETFNHENGKLIGKGMHPDKIKQGLIDIKTQYPNLLISTGFIAGLPYDTPESLNETINWLEKSPVDSYSFQVLSLGGRSEFGQNKEKYGYKIDTNGNWYTNNLDYKTAFKIADRTKVGTLSSFTFYNRLRNLDFLPDEVAKLTIKDKLEIIKRFSNKIDQYKKKIL
jgi:radical SAM superfamily enzyme YgiQ (UPF0313 family)